MEQSYLSSLIAFHSQIALAHYQAGNQKSGNDITTLKRVGIIFDNNKNRIFFTEATMQKVSSDLVCEAYSDGDGEYNGPSVMCQSTFL
jgi:hypothetical protein